MQLVPAGASSAVVCRYRSENDPALAYFGQLAGSGSVSDPSLLAAFIQQLNALQPVVAYPLGPNEGPPSCPFRDDDYFTLVFDYPGGPQDVVKSSSDWCTTLTNGEHESSLTFSNSGTVWSELDELTGCPASEVGFCDEDPLPDGGAPTFALALSKGRLSFGGRPLTLTIRIQTALAAQTAGVGLTTSGWPDPALSGSPLKVSEPTVAGAGKLVSHFVSSGIGLGVVCSRGTFTDGAGGVDLALPANSITTLTYIVTLAAPPWPGLTPTVGAFAYVPATGSGIPARQLGQVKVPLDGPTGVRITLTARGAARPTEPGGAFVLDHAGKVVIRGTTAPVVRHALVRIAVRDYLRAGLTPSPAPLGAARTDGRGRFALTWRAPTAGTYQVSAAIPHPGHGLLADRTCDLPLSVR